MSISPISSSPISSPQAQFAVSQAANKKNDHDGDEINGADPKNESDSQASQIRTPSKPYLGNNVNTVA
jgi:hypothetical protein